MTAYSKLPAGVLRIPTTTIEAEHTKLTEILSGTVVKRLAITEPRTAFKSRMHRHLRRDDYIYVLSGEVSLKIYDGTHHATIPVTPKGDVIMVPKGIFHGYETGTEKTIILEASSEAFDPHDTEELHGEDPL